jgi:hypothetical protein
VQRSDADLCVFDVTYQGEHTCHQKQRHQAAAATTAHGGGGSQSPPAPAPSRHEHDDDQSMQLLMCFKDALKVETGPGPLHHHHHDREYYYDHGPASAPAATFSFPSAPFGEAAAPAVFSPPGSSYFSAPPHHCPAAVAGGSYDVVYDYGETARVRGRGAESSELGEVVSRATGCDYSSSSLYHHAGLDPHQPFPPFGGPSHGPFQ